MCTSSISVILFLHSLTPFQKDSLIEPLLMLKGTMKDQEAKDQVGHSLHCLPLATKWEQWGAEQNAYLRISTQYSAWSKTLYTYLLCFLLSSKKIFCTARILYYPHNACHVFTSMSLWAHTWWFLMSTNVSPTDGNPDRPHHPHGRTDRGSRVLHPQQGNGHHGKNSNITKISMLWCIYHYNHHYHYHQWFCFLQQYSRKSKCHVTVLMSV